MTDNYFALAKVYDTLNAEIDYAKWAEYIDEKIMKLKMILPSIEGKKGTLRMENYTPDSSGVTFELDE